MQDFVAIDFETANARRSSICSIGAVVVRGGVIADRIYRLVRPEPDYYCYWNTRVHGLTEADTQSEPFFPDVWKDIAPAIAGLPLVAHNKAFDESCLKHAFQAYGMNYPDYEFHCTLVAARRRFPQLASHKLDVVAEECGYCLANHHHALADAEACAMIALRIL